MFLRMPAEHGSWGMVAVPFVCAGAVAGEWDWPLALAAVCVLVLFLLRGSAEAQGGWRTVLFPGHLILAGVSTIAGGVLVLFYQRYSLLLVGGAAVALFFLHRRLIRAHEQHRNEKRSLAAELVGAAILSLSAPAAWIAARGSLDSTGFEVWLLNLLFFQGGVLYVKYRVRGLLAHRGFHRVGERLAFAWPVLVFHLLLVIFLVCWLWFASRPVAVAVAFAPGVLRACGLLFQLGQRFSIRQLGWSEVVHSVLFGALLILAFQLAA